LKVPSQTAINALLVEDDLRIGQLTQDYLEKNGLKVTRCTDGQRGLEEARRGHFDIILLDLMLPNKSGWEICREVRERSDVPIILLTAKTEEADRVMGLELGADDYVAKPYSARELLARIHALLRRAQGKVGPAKKRLEVGELALDPGARRAWHAGNKLTLTSYEFSILQVLMERAGRILSRDQLMELAKGSNDEAFDRSIDVHIFRLRQKLGDEAKQLLKTIRGAGYTLAVEGG
jgi:DNA-binding response OmpR family regulator